MSDIDFAQVFAATPEGSHIDISEYFTTMVEDITRYVAALREIAHAGEGVPDWRGMADIAREALTTAPGRVDSP